MELAKLDTRRNVGLRTGDTILGTEIINLLTNAGQRSQ